MLGHRLQEGGLHLAGARLISSASTRWLKRAGLKHETGILGMKHRCR